MTDRAAPPRWVRFVSGWAGDRPTPVRWIAALALVSVLSALHPSTALAGWQGPPARQVVVFGVMAKPGSSEMDPKIAPVVQAQLRKLLPGHGFQIIKIKGDRVVANKEVKVDLGGGTTATARLINPADLNGKVQMRFDLSMHQVSQFQTFVSTPPDQFNFFDKALPDGNRLLVGVGAR